MERWRRSGPATVQQKREEVYAALLDASSFHRLVEEWHDCEKLKPTPKDTSMFVDKEGEAQDASHGVCGHEQISLLESGVQRPNSEGRRLADLDLVRVAQSTSRRHTGGGRTRQRASR